MAGDLDMTLELPEDVDKFVVEYAEKHNMTYSEVINLIVKWYLANNPEHEKFNGGV